MTAPVVLVRRAPGVAAAPVAGARIVGPGELAAAAEEAAPADVVVIDGDVAVGEGWLEGLREAAWSDSTVATAGAVLLGGGGDAPAFFAGAPVARVPEGVPRCCWVRRAALELAGPLDDRFWERCVRRGLIHLEVGSVVAVVAGELPETHDAADVSRRYGRPPGPRERSRALARRRRDGAHVTVDARVLTGVSNGTQVHALALLRALARTGEARLRALLPIDPAPEALAALDELGVETLIATEVDPAPRTPVVHRPYQFSSHLDMKVLRQVGERIVVTHQDLLLFHNPAYHVDEWTWSAYRRLTASSLAVADLVVATSEHSAQDLVAEDLVAADRLRTVPLGTDHLGVPAPGARPAGAPDRPFLLCLGSDLLHKNRPFAIDLVAALRRDGWDGGLVLAGGHAEHGSSAAEERRDDDVIDLGFVDEAAREWLYANAAAVVYPTTYEGFGLVPFEAAAAGTPCLFAPQAALAEVLADQALLVPWDATASAARALPVLRDPDAHVGAVRAAGEQLTWDATARALLAVYDEALTVPPPERTGAAWRALEAEERYWILRREIGETGMSLVAGRHALPEDVQRTLAGLARRAPTRRVLLGALRVLRRGLGSGRS